MNRDGVRLDRQLADAAGCGRRSQRDLFAEHRVLVDGRPRPPSWIAPAGARVQVLAGEAPTTLGRVAVVAETFEVVVLAKPAGMHSHSGRGHDSVAAWLQQHRPEVAATSAHAREGGLVHRLDRDTSGVIVAARTAGAWQRARAAFPGSRTRKHYLALVEGRIESGRNVEVDLARRGPRAVPVGRDQSAVGRCWPAVTAIAPLELGRDWTLVQAVLRTGAPHQVRAHLAAIGHPLIGDSLYGARTSGMRRGHLLHALRIEIEDLVDASAPVEADFLASLAWLRRR